MKQSGNRSMFPHSLILEPGTSDMFDELAELHNIVDAHDNIDHFDLDGNFFRSSYAFPGIILSRDVILGRTLNGLLIAVGTVFPDDSSSLSARLGIQVHPDYRRQGVGSRILKHMLQRAAARHYEVAACRILSFRADAIQFAEHRCFSFSQIRIKMQLECHFPIQPSIVPTELNIREIEIPKEVELWFQLQNEIFQSSHDYRRTSRESLIALTNHSSFDPDLVIVGEVKEVPVGICYGLTIQSPKSCASERTLRIDGLGILPEYRGKGYGQALLSGILNRACLKNHKKCELLVNGSNIEAFRLYTKFGFRERYGHLWYKRATTEMCRSDALPL